MNRVTFETALASISEVETEDFRNPFLTEATFIFCDDRPNNNKQGISEEDFGDIIKTAIDMPIKMNFAQAGIGNHSGAIPIGHIKQMYKNITDTGINQLIAKAVLYADEYPEEITYLKEAHAQGRAPGISYELAYADTVVSPEGVSWLKKIITLAATFVRSPAYGRRTALIALASAKELSLSDVAREVSALAKAEENENPDEGGNKVEQEELERLRAEATTKTAEIETLKEQLAAKDSEIATLNEKVAGMEKAQLIEGRTRKFVEAGFKLEAEAEKADKKKAFWASLSDEAFEEYLADLISAKAEASKLVVAQASDKTPSFKLPKPTEVAAIGNISKDELAAEFRGLRARG